KASANGTRLIVTRTNGTADFSLTADALLPVTSLNAVAFTLSGTAVPGETWNASVGNNQDASYPVAPTKGLSEVLDQLTAGLDGNGYVALNEGNVITVAGANALTPTSSRTLVGHSTVSAGSFATKAVDVSGTFNV